MSEKTDAFIQTVGLLAKNEYLSRDRWVLPSVCIAQAALESGWNLNARTLFGIKSDGSGDSFTMNTSEYCNGHYEEIQAAFKNYPTIAAAVKGYFDLICGLSRYAAGVCNADYKDAIQKIWEGGYATDPDYVGKIVSIIETYGLTSYDSRESEQAAAPSADNDSKGTTSDKTYTVQSGDTLWGIAKRFLGDGNRYPELAQINGISNPDVIQVGQVIRLVTETSPAASTTISSNDRTYTVQSGDTLWGIASRLFGNGNRYNELAEKNSIANPSLIYPGQVIHY